MYMWIVLVWFASDNIAGYLTSPIFFYPLVLMAGLCVILHQLGLLKLFIDMGMPKAKTTLNGILE